MLAAGVEVRDMRVCGGPAQSEAWNQIKADVTGFTVAVPRGARDGRARQRDPRGGRDRDVPGPPDGHRGHDPRSTTASRRAPANADVYDRLFEAYVALYPATAPILRPLAGGAA